MKIQSNYEMGRDLVSDQVVRRMMYYRMHISPNLFVRIILVYLFLERIDVDEIDHFHREKC